MLCTRSSAFKSNILFNYTHPESQCLQPHFIGGEAEAQRRKGLQQVVYVRACAGFCPMLMLWNVQPFGGTQNFHSWNNHKKIKQSSFCGLPQLHNPDEPGSEEGFREPHQDNLFHL